MDCPYGILCYSRLRAGWQLSALASHGFGGRRYQPQHLAGLGAGIYDLQAQ
jgi:hypothetical protein